MKLLGKPDEPCLWHHLAVSPKQRRVCPGIGEVAKSIRNKRWDCRRGVMSQYGWAWSSQGPTSDFHQPEMLVLVSQGGLREINSHVDPWWFGHVFFMCRNRKGRWMDDGQRYWVSLLAQCDSLPDAVTAYLVLKEYRHKVIRDRMLPPDEKLPDYLERHRDTCSFHDTMEEAIDMTAVNIREFRRAPVGEGSCR